VSRAARAAALALLLLAGCGGKSEPSTPDTGARAAVEEFYNALVANEPPRAYAVLDRESQRRVPPERFAALAAAYLKNVGFHAERVQVRACEEQGDAATARVVIAGHSVGHSRRYNDGITLRRTDGRWGVVLPANFGRKAR
jgi:hypothetical protein